MRKIILAMAIVSLLSVGVVVYWKTDDREDPPVAAPAVSQRSRKAQDITRFKREQQEPLPLNSMSHAELESRYAELKYSLRSEKRVGMLEKGICSYHSIYDRETKTYIQGKYGVPLDIPKVEFRFRKRDAEGNLVPHPVGCVLTYPVWNGRSHPSRGRELFRAMDCDQTDEYDFAYAARFFLSDDAETGEYDALVFGQTYYIDFLYPEYETLLTTPDAHGSALIRMPDHVERGKVAVFTVDVTKRAEGWGRPGSYSRKKKQVHIRVRNVPSVPYVGASLHDPGQDLNLTGRVSRDGEAEVGVYELGGELAIMAFVAKEEGHLLYYKRRVTETEVEFPKDADIVVDPDEVLTFRVKVPRKKVPERSIGLGLVLDRGSKLAVAAAEFEPYGHLPPAVEMMASPGAYYVAYDFNPPTVIGKITIKKSDSGKTLEVQALGE